MLAIFQYRFTIGVDRPNVAYGIVQKDLKNPLEQLSHYVEEELGSSELECGIIICPTPEMCDSFCEHLRARGINARTYYANMDLDEKYHVLELWLDNQVAHIACQ